MLSAAVVLAIAFAFMPFGARAAGLVVWWDKPYYAQEEEALHETIAAFEQKTGKQVELVLIPLDDFPGKVEAALASGQPPDFAFGVLLGDYVAQWAVEDRLADLSDAVGAFSNLFDPDALARVTWRDPKTGQSGLYGLPVGREINHVHVWKSLLERAGFSVNDIPKEWEAFWSFWCDRAQPAVRKALGREDIWGVALPMSAKLTDTDLEFFQFVEANNAGYVTRDGELIIDDPEIKQRLVKTMDSYTAIYRNGCTRPESVTWASGYDNNREFLTQAAIMTANVSLSIPNELKHRRPEDYHKNTATIEWPLGAHGERFPIVGTVVSAVVFKGGSNAALAKEFVRFLVAEGWLAHYLDFSAERFLPAMSKLLEQPYWLDPSDPHQMASVMQMSSRRLAPEYAYAEISGNWRHQLVNKESVWGNAVHRVAADGITPEQAVDEAIARIKQILAE
jgi:multiple sugar transport system substrate-binding protein